MNLTQTDITYISIAIGYTIIRFIYDKYNTYYDSSETCTNTLLKTMTTVLVYTSVLTAIIFTKLKLSHLDMTYCSLAIGYSVLLYGYEKYIKCYNMIVKLIHNNCIRWFVLRYLHLFVILKRKSILFHVYVHVNILIFLCYTAIALEIFGSIHRFSLLLFPK